MLFYEPTAVARFLVKNDIQEILSSHAFPGDFYPRPRKPWSDDQIADRIDLLVLCDLHKSNYTLFVAAILYCL